MVCSTSILSYEEPIVDKNKYKTNAMNIDIAKAIGCKGPTFSMYNTKDNIG